MYAYYRYHHVLKVLLRGKRNRRLDHLLHTLFEVALPHYRWQRFRRISGFEGPTVAGSMRATMEEKASLIPLNDIFEEDDGIFHVKSQSNKDSVYAVDTKTAQFNCSSWEDIKFCKHVGAVYRLHPSLRSDFLPELPDSHLEASQEEADLATIDGNTEVGSSDAEEDDEEKVIVSNEDGKEVSAQRDQILDDYEVIGKFLQHLRLNAAASVDREAAIYLQKARAVLTSAFETASLPPPPWSRCGTGK